MKDMSSLDASLLALIADTVHAKGSAQRNTQVLRRLRDLAMRIQDGDLRQAAAALISGTKDIAAYPQEVQDTIRRLRSWAERNRRVHAPVEHKSAF
jgi:hypothetical protein